MTDLRHELRLLLTAVQFFTRLPVPAWVGWSAAQAAASVRYLPAVGWAVGALFGTVLLLALALWPAPLAVGLALWAGLWFTGAFHEDGFADCCDALGGHLPPERALAVMKDSRVGAYAVIGLIVLLGLKAAAWVTLLAQAPPLPGWHLAGVAGAVGPAGTAGLLATAGGILGLAIASHALSRLAPLVVMARLDYVRPEGSGSKSQPLASQRPGAGALAWAALWALAPLAALPALGWPLSNGVAAGLGAAGVMALAVVWLRRRLGGYVGDTLGAVQQATELAFLLGMCARV